MAESSIDQEVRALTNSGKIAEAIQLLKTQAPKSPDGVENSNFFYNLGTLYLRLGKTGTALAYLEKANHLRPHDKDIRHNLLLAQTTLSRTLGEERLDAASSWTEKLADHFSLNEVRGTLGLFGLILLLFWIRSYWKKRDLVKTLFQPAGILGMLGFGIAATLYGAQRVSVDHPAAVSLERQVIRSGPGEHYLELGNLEAGMKVRMAGQSQDATLPSGPVEKWDQIRYSPNEVGWVRAANLLIL